MTKTSTKKPEKKFSSDSKARTASAAVFFNENKSIAGFGNPLRAVFTSIRELVENALDAAEKRNVTPNIWMKLMRMSLDEVSTLMDIDKSRLKNNRLDFLRLTCRDNGVGVPRELIPQLFGTVLAGTKYGAQQTRGRFGLGSKMVLLYSMSTLDLPIQIITRPMNSEVTYKVKLLINLEKNQPIIVEDVELQEGDEGYLDDFGTEISVSFTGDWSRAKNYVKEYFRQLAIITPYADFRIELPKDSQGEDDILEFKRVVDDLPDPPRVVPVHPWGTDVTTFRREMGAANPDHNLIEFLVNNFMGVTEQSAKAFFEEVGVDPHKKPSELTDKEVRRIVHDGFARAFRESKEIKRKRDRIFKFDEPKGDALSPLGADRLRKGIEKELNPAFVEAITRPPKAYEGHPFIIEVAVGYGGGVAAAAASKAATTSENKIIYRFANRIPLIFGPGNDVITQVINQIKWNEYGLTRQSEPLAIAVSLVSTKIPFPETSKEYIDKVEEIEEEIKLAIFQLGRKLRSYLSRSRRRQREKQRRSRFERYAPRTVKNLLTILEKANLWDPYTGTQPQRIIASLSSGDARIGRLQYPRFRPLYQEHVWSYPSHVSKLQNNGIMIIEEFLRRDNRELAKILKISAAKVDEMKRRTILEGSNSGVIGDFDSSEIIRPDIEKRFHTKDASFEFPRLSKAFTRRWIRNNWDYLVTPNNLLRLVAGYIPKLIESTKLELLYEIREEKASGEQIDVLSELLDSEFGLEGREEDLVEVGGPTTTIDTDIDMEELFKALEIDDPSVAESLKQQTDLDFSMLEEGEKGEEEEETEEDPYARYQGKIKQELMLPSIDEILSHPEVKKRKVSNTIEFLIETAHPGSPITFQTIGDLLIKKLKDALANYVAVDPTKADLPLDTKHDWIDGYIRNAFKRRKLQTVKDVLAADDEILTDINELLRSLFGATLEKLKKERTPIRIIQTENEFRAIIEGFEKLGITTMEDLAGSSSVSIAKSKKADSLINAILDKTKDQLIQSLIINNNVYPLELLKWIPEELEDELYKEQIFDYNHLLRTPVVNFSPKTKKRLIFIKETYGTSLGIYSKSIRKRLNDMGVYCLEELVFSADLIGKQEEDKELVNTLIEDLITPVSILSTELIRSEDLLNDVGINTFGRFMVWPSEEIAYICDLTEEWVNLIKEGVNIKSLQKAKKRFHPITDLSHIFSKIELEVLSRSDFKYVEEISSLVWEIVFPKVDSTEKFIDHQERLLGSSHQLVEIFTFEKEVKNLTKALTQLEKAGFKTVYDILKQSPTDLLNKVKGKRAVAAMEMLIIGIQGGDEEVLDTNSKLFETIVIYKIKEKLKLALSHLSEFTNDEVETLTNAGIKTIQQFVSLGFDECAKILNKTKKFVKEKFFNSSLREYGTPIAKYSSTGRPISIFTFELEGVTYFSEKDVIGILNSGYSTIESLYYKSNSKTFEVPGISWEVMSHVKSLLRSPAVLLSWREEVTPTEEGDPSFKYVTLSATELRKLSDSKFTRVIDFLTLPTETLAQILDWDLEFTKERQTSAVLQEVGIELDEMNLFRNEDLKILADMNIHTIEDVYFSTFEESWKDSSIPWEAIRTIKNILRLPIKYVEEELGEEIVELLEQNEINNILDFLLTGDPILAQKTGLPAERFENLKHALDFPTLIETFDKSVCFIPDVDYYQAKQLITRNIHKVADFINSKDEELAKLMDVPKQQISRIKDQISRISLAEREVEEGITLRDIRIFSRADIRSIAHSGVFEFREIKTVQELMYHVSEQSFYSSKNLWKRIHNLKRALRVPLKRLSTISQEEIRMLAKEGIKTIEDIIFISVDVSYDPSLEPIISRISREIGDLRPIVALGELPASAASREDCDGNLLDYWLDDDKRIDEEFKRRLFNVMLLPIRAVRFGQLLHEVTEEIAEMTLADACLFALESVDDSLALIKSAISTNGALLTILNEARTPITLLDIDVKALRTLYDMGITVVEELILKDPRYISGKTGMSQKYLREIAKQFVYGRYTPNLREFGVLLIRILTTDEEISELQTRGVNYLEQIPSLKGLGIGVVDRLLEFVFGSNIFLLGYPGEYELVKNQGATTIIESLLALKKLGMDADSILDITILAYRTRYYYRVPLHKKPNIRKSIFCIQDLISYAEQVGFDKLTKKERDMISPYLKSTLFLPLNGSLLEDLVYIHRCTRVIDALTCPMVGDELGSIRNQIEMEGSPSLELDVAIPVIHLKKIANSEYKRFPAGADITFQDIIGYPRLLREYQGIRATIYEAALNKLDIPLSRIVYKGRQVGSIEGVSRLSKLVCRLPYLKKEKPNVFKMVMEIITSDFSTVNEVPFIDKVRDSVSTAFGRLVLGFHELWAISLTNYEAIEKSESEFARLVKKMIQRSFLSVSSIPKFSEEEIWILWKNSVYTVAEFLLASNHIPDMTTISRKRYSEMYQEALDFTVSYGRRKHISLFEISTSLGMQLDHLERTELPNLYSTLRHPLARTMTSFSDIHFTLSLPIVLTRCVEFLSMNDIKQILRSQIFSIADFLMFPENSDKIPPHIKSLQQRIDLISKGYEMNRKDIDISVLELPEEIKEELHQENIRTLSSLISYYLDTARINKKSVFTVSLRFTPLESKVVDKLTQIGVETILDLFIAPPKLIQSVIDVDENWAFEHFIGFDYRRIWEEVQNAFLPLDKISAISQKGITTLNTMNYYSLFDVPRDLPDGVISRNDWRRISSLFQLVDSPASLILHLSPPDEVIQVVKEKDVQTIKDLIFAEDEKVRRYMKSRTADELISILERLRPLTLIEAIRNKERKLFTDAGKFTYEQIAKSTLQEIIDLGIPEERAEEIITTLNYGIESIMNLPEELLKRAKQIGCRKVWELLDSNELLNFEIDKALVLRKPLMISNLFEAKLARFLEELNVDTIDKIFESKELVTAVEKNEKEACEVIRLLHHDLSQISEISSRWINPLSSIGIEKIWQFFVRSEEEVSAAVGSTVKSVIDLKTRIYLQTDLRAEADEFISNIEILKRYERIGLTKLRDFRESVVFPSVRDVNFSGERSLREICDSLSGHIWEVRYFWKIPVDKQEDIARNNSGLLYEMVSSDGEYLLKIIESAIVDPRRELIEVDSFKNEENTELKYFEQWLYLYLSGKYKADKVTEYFRTSIANIEGITTKNILRAYDARITHISDIYSLGIENASKQMAVKPPLSHPIALNSEMNALYPIGLLSKNIHDILVASGFKSWLQVIGNTLEADYEGYKGITKNSFKQILEVISTPVWVPFPLRNFGLQVIKRLIRAGIKTVGHILILPLEHISQVTKLEEEKISQAIQEITRAELNRSLKQTDVPLSISRKIRVADIPELEKMGITSSIQILVGDYKLPKNSPWENPISDLVRIFSLSLDNLDIPEKNIVELKEHKIKTIGELLILSDPYIRKLCSISPVKLKLVRTKLPRKSPGKLEAKKSAPKKKDTAKKEKKKSETAKKKSTSTKKDTAKKGNVAKKEAGSKQKEKVAKKPTVKKKTKSKSAKKTKSGAKKTGTTGKSKRRK